MLNKTVKEFLEEISSENPTPGGGSVSAFCGVLSACLFEMSCKLTIGKENYKNVEEQFKIALNIVSDLRRNLEKLSLEDANAYNEVMRAYKILKKDKRREKKIHNALKKATIVPLNIAENCSELLKVGKYIAKNGNTNCLSDAGVGLMLTLVGIKGSALNIKMNIKKIKDEKFKEEILKKLKEIEKKADINF